MPTELIFTSVPKGVKPGSTGYCTVAKHKGIDRLLDQAVEKLCFYELMKLTIKPVVHNYSIHSLNTGIFHVLTRTCYSGSDHTGRTNYISHNLIFDQAEALSQLVSPAEIFLRGTGWLSAWPEGQSPMFFQEGICNVAIPKPSGDSSCLPTWEQLTGKSNSAHELKGYASWKFITEGGEHNKTLSLLSEFSWLDPSYLEISWNQLTFTTYLQPSEKATNFRIVAGDPSVPAFNAISCATLNISSSGGANACFSSSGTGHFGPLPEIHQPIVEEHQNPVETVPIEPVYVETPFQAKHPPKIPVQPKSPTTSPTPKSPRRKSNLNLGKPGDSENLYDSADIPKGKGADGKSKLLILLISFFGFLVLGAAILAGVFFWPEKAKRGNTHSPEIAKAENLDELDVNESKTSSGEKESYIDDNEKSKVPEEGLANTNKEKTSKSENSLDSLKDKFSKLVIDINSTIDSHAKDEGLESKFTQLYELKNKIEKNDPAPNNTIYNDKIKELEDKRDQKKLSQNPLPKKIPLEINERSTVSEFSFDDSGKPLNPEKTFYWDHKNKTSTEEGQNSMHIAYWTTDKRNDDGTTTQTFHLHKDNNISYKVDKNSFPKLKIKEADFEVRSLSEPPDLNFKLDIKDVRITERNENRANLFRALNELKVEEVWAKSNLKYALFHENGPATNNNGELLTEDGNNLAGLSEHFIESTTAILIRERISKEVTNIDTSILANEGQENNYKDSKQELSDLLKSKLDFSKKHEELEIEITKKAIAKITKFTFHDKLPSKIKSIITNAFKKKNLFSYSKSSQTYKFYDWYDLKKSCVNYKEETYDKKISDAAKKLDDYEDDRKEYKKEIGFPDKKEKTELGIHNVKIEKSKKDLRELNSQKIKDIKNFDSNFPKEPKEFKKFKSSLEKCLSTAIRKQKPLTENEVKSLREYKKNLQNFLKGPQYPWYVRNKISNNIVLIIE